MYTTLLTNILSNTNDLLSDHDFICENKVKPSDFTRKRCLEFKTLFWSLCSSTKKSLQTETALLPKRFDEHIPMVSAQAFSKYRAKMKPEAIYSIMRNSAKNICEHAATKTYKGYRIFAVDGTNILLPDTEKTREAFGIGGNQLKTVALAGASILYDTLNDIIVDGDIFHVDESERAVLECMIRRTGKDYTGEQRIITLDRGYPSREMFHLLNDLGYKYVIRTINADCSPKYIREAITPDTIARDNKDKTILHRIIKIRLDSGVEEILLSNLTEEEFTISDFYEIYHLRWSIETKYSEVKHKYCVEKFTGYSPCAIRQEFFMTLFLSNLTALMKRAGEDELRKDMWKRNKWEYILNRTTVIRIWLQYLPQLFMYPELRGELLRKMLDILKKRCSAVRNDRHVKRKKKHATRTYRLNQK